MEKLIGKLTPVGQLTGKLSAVGQISGEITIPERITPPEYEGEYIVTPTEEEQVLQTNGRYTTQNIVVHAIPRNYGLITYDGSIITVS